MVAGLLIWYFTQDSRKNKVEISVVGTNCDRITPEIYLLVINSGEEEILGNNIQLTLTDRKTKQKTTIRHSMARSVKPHQFRQDTVLVPIETLNFDCREYEIKAKVKK